MTEAYCADCETYREVKLKCCAFCRSPSVDPAHQKRAVPKRDECYEAHIEKTYREVWRLLKRRGVLSLMPGIGRELSNIFNNPYSGEAVVKEGMR